MSESKNRKEEILHVALDEFTREGYSGARLQQIADNTGATKAMIHYYFKTKENLFREAYRLVCQDLMNDLFAPLEGKYSLYSKIEAFVDKVINRFDKQPKRAEFLINELNHHPEITLKVFQENYKCDFTILDQQLKEAADSYEIAPVNSRQLLGNILSLCIFPVTGRAFLKETLEREEANFESFLEQRREVVKDTVLNWLAG